MDIKEIEAILEALLFTSGDILTLDKISEILGLDKKTMKNIMNSIVSSYNNLSRGIMIREIDGGYQLCTRPEFSGYLKKMSEHRQKQGLSQAALETLAIIAYNQPVTKAAIEKVRGVNSESAITRLLEKNLIKEAGRLDCPGKPILYESTVEFLRVFGFKSLNDLPEMSTENQEVFLQQM